MKIQNAREYFLTLNQRLSLLGALKGSKFSFTIAKNKEVIKPTVDKLNKMIKMSNRFMEFDKKRVEINEKYAERDEKGNPIMKEERFTIPNDKKEDFEKEIEALKTEYKDAVSERETQKKELEAFLKEEITLDFKTIPLSIIPEDINVDEMEILAPLVEE